MNNFRGRKEKIQFSYHAGFFNRFSINYHGFYLDKKRKHSISALVNLFTQNSVPYGTQNNKQVSVKTEDKVMDNKVISLIYSYRSQVKTLHHFNFSYEYNAISDTVVFFNPEFLGIQNMERSIFTLRYNFSFDTRDSRAYPTKGISFVAGFKQFGLGILEHKTFSTNISSNIVVHNQISKSFYTSFSMGVSYLYTNDYSFFPYHGLGYGEFIRGYEHYVVDGQLATIAKSMIRYQLLSDKIIHLNFWPIRKLHQFNKVPIAIYTSIYFDSGYVYDQTQYSIVNNNSLVNKIMFGYGVGIDFVTYYDKVFRLDYSFNKFGEHGIFIHWEIGIR